MKIFHGSGSCSIGILVVLEELGLAYDLQTLDLAAREQTQAPYATLNPKAKVPALQLDDGSILTEWTAIAAYVAGTSGKLDTDALTLARTLEAVDYIVATVHMQGFTRIVRPGNFTPNEADFDAVVARGREIFDKGMALIDHELEGREFVIGDRWSIADAALFYVEHWKAARLQESLPPNCQAHYDRMMARDGVKRALAKG